MIWFLSGLALAYTIISVLWRKYKSGKDPLDMAEEHCPEDVEIEKRLK